MTPPDKIADYIARESAQIERLPRHLRAAKADFIRRDFERKEAILLAWATAGNPGPMPFNGDINAFDTARVVNHFAGIAAKYREFSYA